MDLKAIREQFPILQRKIYDKYPLVYLDNGATTQKPLCVLDAMREEYLNANANVHRGVHYLSQQATDLHEAARESVRRFINARRAHEIIFTRGTTESVNLMASSFTERYMKPGDEVIVSVMEHHSNIVPWQLAAKRWGIRLRVIPMSDDGTLDLEAYAVLFNDRTRLVSVAQVSNVLGTVNPIKDMVAVAHSHGVPFLVDGAQSAPHLKVDVQDLDCDFFAFSGHKMYGPTGIGVLYGKEEYLNEMPPYQGGGDMIGTVTFEETTYAALPYKFEAGTPDYVAAHGLAQAVGFMEELGVEAIEKRERELTAYAAERLLSVDGMTLFGPHDPARRGGVFSFLVRKNGDFIHHLDMGTLLDRLGIAVRTGHHCAEPLMRRLGVQGTVRASFAVYNTEAEIDALVDGVRRVSAMF